MRYYIDDNLGIEYHREQFRFPRSKKKRIRKKWAKQNKNYRSWRTQKPMACKMNGVLIMNSLALDELKSAAVK
jgi:hypothetical protein